MVVTFPVRKHDGKHVFVHRGMFQEKYPYCPVSQVFSDDPLQKCALVVMSVGLYCAQAQQTGPSFWAQKCWQ